MKTNTKLLFLSFLLLIVSQSGNAQAHFRRPVYGDFFGGMTISHMDLKDKNRDKDLKIGFMVGGNINYRFFHNMQLQSGFYLIKKGLIKHDIYDAPLSGDRIRVMGDIKHTVDANYIQIPLNIGFEIPLSTPNRLYLNFHVGVFGAYGFKGDYKTKGYEARYKIDNEGNKGEPYEYTYPSSSQKTFSNQKLKRWDYGLNGNIGIVYDIYIIQFQYDHGLANVATNLISDTAFKTEWRTRNYSISLGFRF